MSEEWQDISTAPHEGKFLVAEYAPTNWAYYVKTVRIIEGMPERHRDIQLRYATHWMPYPPEPSTSGVRG